MLFERARSLGSSPLSSSTLATFLSTTRISRRAARHGGGHGAAYLVTRVFVSRLFLMPAPQGKNTLLAFSCAAKASARMRLRNASP